MENITMTEEQYKLLITIKTNAKTLAITKSDEYAKIVLGLCNDYERSVDDRIKQLEKEIDEIREEQKKIQNENRH
jgi:tRNA(Phe) wybutosine-synthesizing methylase Tyw3